MYSLYSVGFSSNKAQITNELGLWQYWWWFWFAILWTFYMLVILLNTSRRIVNFNPNASFSLKGHGRWGDFLISIIPLCWCANIVISSNHILRLIEFQTEGSLFSVRVYGKQWYWAYFYGAETTSRLSTVYKNVGRDNWFCRQPFNYKIEFIYYQLSEHNKHIKLDNKHKSYLQKGLIAQKRLILENKKTPNSAKLANLVYSKYNSRTFSYNSIRREFEMLAETTKKFKLDLILKNIKFLKFEILKKNSNYSKTLNSKTHLTIFEKFNLLSTAKFKFQNIAHSSGFTPYKIDINKNISIKIINFKIFSFDNLVNNKYLRVDKPIYNKQNTYLYLIEYGQPKYRLLKILTLHFRDIKFMFNLVNLVKAIDTKPLTFPHIKTWKTNITELNKLSTLITQIRFLDNITNIFSETRLLGSMLFDRYKLISKNSFFTTTLIDNSYLTWESQASIDLRNKLNAKNAFLKLQKSVTPVRLIRGVLNENNLLLLKSETPNLNLFFKVQFNYKHKNIIAQPKVEVKDQISVEQHKKVYFKRLPNSEVLYYKYTSKDPKKIARIRALRKLMTYRDYQKSRLLYDGSRIVDTLRNHTPKRHTIPVTLTKRLMRTRKTLILPTNINLSLITSSFDVVHSWFVPGLGLKLDCIPGKSTQHSLYVDTAGFYYGQCAEICGRFHHHMPIRLCGIPFNHFVAWWAHRNHTLTANNYIKHK